MGDRGTRTPPLKPEVTEQEIDALRRASRPNVGFYAGVTALAILAPRVAAFGYLLIAVAAVLRARGRVGRHKGEPPEDFVARARAARH